MKPRKKTPERPVEGYQPTDTLETPPPGPKDSTPDKPEPPPQQTSIEDVSDKVAFIAALKNGMGLTRGCYLIQKHPREMSRAILTNVEFRRECEEAFKFSAKALLVMSNEFLQKKRFDRWLNQNEYIRNFHVNLNLWESYREKKDVTDVDIIAGYMIYKDFAELATVIGYTEAGLINHVARSPKLSLYFTNNGILK